MNVLLIGGGGREHAVAWKLRQSPRLTDLHIAPGNAGTADLGHNLDMRLPATGSAPADIDAYLDAAVKQAQDLRIDLVFVAPDDPLSWGLVDRLAAAGIAAFGPTAAAASIEASKAWAKEFMTRHGIPHPATRTFEDRESAAAFIRDAEGSLVVKADGLSAGKGAIVTSTPEEALEAVDDLMVRSVAGAAGQRVVIEQRLTGRETSPHAFSDGKTVRQLPLSCDHKAVFDGGLGPNTGGMGVYSSPPWIDAALEERIRTEITEPALAGLAAEGRPFRGVLYPNLMITEGGPQVLEFNARFGDPEAQALLPRLKSDLLEIGWACANQRLADVEVECLEGSSVCVVLASGGYPGSYSTGFPISGLDQLDPDVIAFHAGTRRDEHGSVLTSGGRVLSIVATGVHVAEAREKAYRNVERVTFEGMHYRRDIGAI